MTSRPQNLTAPELASYRKPDRGTQPDYLYPPYVSTVKRSPREPLVMLPISLSELTGPIFGPELIGADDNDLTRQGEAGPIGGPLYILLFGAGATAGMLLLSGVIGLPFVLTASRAPRALALMQVLAGVISSGLGITLL